MKSATGKKAACGLLLLWSILLLWPGSGAAINTVGDYQKSPAFVTSPIQPLTMLLLDNSGSMGNDAYTGAYDPNKNYYGLFETDKYYYHPFNMTLQEICEYEGISGSCDTTATVGTCSYPTRTCETTATSYTCARSDKRTNGRIYDNSVCDGNDGGTATDCRTDRGYSCQPAYTCERSWDGRTDGETYNNSTCDSNDGGSSTDCNTRRGYSCVPVGGASTVDWTGQSCASCPGTCTTTGTYIDPDLDCLDLTVGGGADKCSAFDGSTCTSQVVTQACTWTNWVEKAACEADAALNGGICTDGPTTPGLETTCATVAEQNDCLNLYHGVCYTDFQSTGSRAPYWRKTPEKNAGAKDYGWNCNVGDCIGGSVTLGNRLNHDQMSQMDIAKKVLAGGKVAATSSVAGTIELDGDFNGANSYTCEIGGGTYYDRDCDGPNRSRTCSNGSACVPAGNNGNIVLEPDEPAPKGILQNFEGLAWGFGTFNSPQGGMIRNYIGSPNADIVDAINNTPSTGWTPLAESLNTVVNYFRQTAPEYNSIEYTRNTLWDPFHISGSFAPCGRASVIVITDGEPTADDTFNATIRDAANNSAGISDFIVPSSGTNDYWLDDVAWWGHTNDLRPQANMGGEQNLDVYMIYAFGNDANAISNMKKAAVLGGFIDKNGDGVPNSEAVETDPATTADQREWDFDGDGTADNYADANEGDQLAGKLQNMLGQIQQKVSAGSAASVISASRSGEGAIYQAIFYPKTPPDPAFRTIKWVGDIHSLWLDRHGNMREDCSSTETAGSCTYADGILTPQTDNILELYTDATTGESMVRRYQDPDGDNNYIRGRCTVTWPNMPDEQRLTENECLAHGGTWSVDPTTSDFLTEVSLKKFDHYIWSGGKWLETMTQANTLVQRSYDSTFKQRHIFTQTTGVSGLPVRVPFTSAGMQSAFTANGYKGYLNAATTAEADSILEYIRGYDSPQYRSRLYDWDRGDLVGAEVNKLGDIIGSTPTVVSRPAEDYDVLYRDYSYQRFRKKYHTRRTMIYAGGNDGGMHAFNGGYYDAAAKQFLNAPPGKISYDLGAEMWMFIPKNLLPHLKWLTSPSYSHVYYNDMKPYIFDAKIFPPDPTHIDGWGTILVGGMGFGGGDMTVDLDGDGIRETPTGSAYYVLDITDPEQAPTVLAEFTDPNLGFTTASPTAIPMLRCDRYLGCSQAESASWPMDWYLAFGSGPHNDIAANPSGIQTAMVGTSDQLARVFVMKLGGTGDVGGLPPVSGLNPPSLLSTFSIPAAGFPNSFFSDLIAVDFDLDYKTDSLYFGSIANTLAAGPNYTGGLHRLVTADDLNPASWTLNTFFDAGQPVSAAPAASYDGKKAWLYFGTGRLLDATTDKSDGSQQSYYGLKETYVSNQLDLTIMNNGNLVDVSDIYVLQGDPGNGIPTGALYDSATNAPATLTSTGGDTLAAGTFAELDVEITDDLYDGWKINFPMAKERNLGQASILGKVVSFTTYVPSGDICSAEGESFLWAPYYRTGTAYYKPVIGAGKDVNDNETSLRKVSLGRGMATTPSIHVGAEEGSKAFIQTSTGAIIGIEQENPGVTKSGLSGWRDKNTNSY